MNSILKAFVLSTLFILSSCAHHRGCSKCCDSSQCEMHKDGKKEQCPMKSEHADSTTKEVAPAKK
ncbi:MAG: hypothetical protein PHY93_06645 [Bacteriovorax sp.]|nr:hypothetical protein [Bacteriovorax sp.]